MTTFSKNWRLQKPLLVRIIFEGDPPEILPCHLPRGKGKEKFGNETAPPLNRVDGIIVLGCIFCFIFAKFAPPMPSLIYKPKHFCLGMLNTT